MPDSVPVPIVDLLLDEENPRLTTTHQGQRETIRAMATLQDSRLQALATDITEHGLDPSDLFIVMRGEGKRYVVLDGNRRATALKALENPEIVNGAVSSGVLQAIKRLSRDYDSKANDPVPCIVVNDRPEADHWIELKHTGYQDGAGPLRWAPDEGARFRARTGAVLDAETQALNFLEGRGDIDQEFRRRVPTSTFRRLLRTPAVREKMGLDWKQNSLIVAGEEDAVAKALLYVAKDLSERRITVRDLYSKADRVRYAESLPPEVVVARPAAQDGKRADARPKRRSSNPTTKRRTRAHLIPDDLPLNINDTRIRDIESELRRLNLGHYPNAISVLFRVFLELSADAYIEDAALSGVAEKASLGTKLQATARDLVDRKRLTRQEAKVVRRASQRDSFLGPSITGMHQYVHNKHLFPGPADLRADWDSLQPWFEAVWGL